MDPCLTADDVALLASTSATLLAPFEHRTLNQWAEAARASLACLVEADRSALLLPRDADVQMVASDDGMYVAAREYLAYYRQFDIGLNTVRPQMGADVWSRKMLWDRAEFLRSPYSEFCVRHALKDAIGLAAIAGAGTHTVHLYRDGTAGFSDLQVALLRGIWPSFEAGLAAWYRLSAIAESWGSALDELGRAVLLYDADGIPLHVNSALVRMFEAEADRTVLRAALDRIAGRLCDLQRQPQSQKCVPGTFEEFTTRSARYHLRGCYAERLGCGRRSIIVAVGRVATDHLVERDLQVRFRLTPREAKVGILLVQGLSNAKIASVLCISPCTARHHTESVFLKLGVHSRVQLVAKLHQLLIPSTSSAAVLASSGNDAGCADRSSR